MKLRFLLLSVFLTLLVGCKRHPSAAVEPAPEVAPSPPVETAVGAIAAASEVK